MSLTLVGRPEPAQSIARFQFDWAKLLLAVNVAALLAAAFALRAWHLGNLPGLNGDEAWSGVQAVRLVNGQPISWWTPTGNPVNLFYLGPLAALHLFVAPSITVLRLPALVSGLAALAVNFFLCRRVLGARTASIATVTLAVLPLNIAYCRFGWDASQTLLATTLLMYLALLLVPLAGERRSSLLGPMLAFGAAVWIHPTNLFAVWLLIVPGLYAYRRELSEQWWRARSSRLFWPLAAAFGLAVLVAGMCLRGPGLAVLQRASDASQWGLFLRLLVRLFSGSTIFEFICGPSAGSAALNGADLVFVCLALAAAWGLGRVLRRADAERERCLAVAALALGVSFYLFAGPAAIAPHFERYGVCLIAPGALLLARGLAFWLGGTSKAAMEQRAVAFGWQQIGSRSTVVVLSAVAWLALGLFGWRYFAFIERTGGESHLAFRTAAVEPKQQAWELIEQASGDDRPIRIVADRWWLYWPMAYLAAEQPRVQVLHRDEPRSESARDSDTSVWEIAFCETSVAGGMDEGTLLRQAQGRTTVIVDYSGRPLLNVFQADGKSPQNY